MKKVLIVLASVFCLAVMASAAPVVCPAPPPPAQQIATVGGGVSSFSYTCDGLTFSNFDITDAGGTPAGQALDLTGATYDPVTGIVDLGFNPNASAVATTEDFHLTFTVTGGITGIDMTLGGTTSTATERACSTVIDALSGTCTGGTTNQLSVLTDTSGNPVNGTPATFALTSPVYIFKDINVASGSELTSFSESFHTAVPEPMTMSLMGAGLLGLGFLGRRRVRK
jgi:hypothetical protein